jgi:hypothetical protein
MLSERIEAVVLGVEDVDDAGFQAEGEVVVVDGEGGALRLADRAGHGARHGELVADVARFLTQGRQRRVIERRPLGCAQWHSVKFDPRQRPCGRRFFRVNIA